jgi:hypothetical protein
VKYVISVIFLYLAFFDAGPKPKMEFNIEYHLSKPADIIEGWQLQSDSESFSRFDTLKKAGPQRFNCEDNNNCRSVSYGYKDYNKLVLKFSDKTRESNVFKRGGFNSSYKVIVTDDSVRVSDVTPFYSSNSKLFSFITAFIITIILELLTAFLFLLIAGSPQKILLWVILANIISLPVLWFIFPLIFGEGIPAFITGELFTFIFETLFIYYYSRQYIRKWQAIVLSVIMNLVSLILGGAIYIFILFIL